MGSFSMTERLCPTGTLKLVYMKGAYPALIDGDIIIDKNKTEVVFEDTDHNLVVDGGRLILMELMTGKRREIDPITKFCTGTGGYIGSADPNSDPTPPSGGDTDLVNPIFEKEIDSISLPNTLAATFTVLVRENESNGNLTEFGLKTKEGHLFCRRTVRPRFKDENVFFVAKWTIQF